VGRINLDIRMNLYEARLQSDLDAESELEVLSLGILEHKMNSMNLQQRSIFCQPQATIVRPWENPKSAIDQPNEQEVFNAMRGRPSE
jgi:hypothetical protein